MNKRGGARYEHVIPDYNGWSLIFIDTGRTDSGGSWPFTPEEEEQKTWLEEALAGPGRARILFSHHSRLSWGKHGDNPALDPVWRRLFDENGNARVAFTLAGHNHNLSVYKPRDRDLKVLSADPTKTIQILVNGGGGFGHYPRVNGTRAEIYPKSKSPADDPVVSSVARIEILDQSTANVTFLDFTDNPAKAKAPKAIPLFQQIYNV